MAQVARNRQVNKTLGSVIQMLLQNMMLEKEQGGRMAYLGEAQAGNTALENLRTGNDLTINRQKSALSTQENLDKYIQTLDVEEKKAFYALADKPWMQQALGLAQIARARGISDPNLMDTIYDMRKKSGEGAAKASRGEAGAEDFSSLIDVGPATVNTGMNVSGTARNAAQELPIKQGNLAVNKGELAVKQAQEARLGKEQEFPTGAKDDVMTYITDTIKYLVGQGVSPEESTEPLTAFKAPAPLSPENQGKALTILNQLRVKRLNKQPLTEDELMWVARVYDASQIGKSGLTEVGPMSKDILAPEPGAGSAFDPTNPLSQGEGTVAPTTSPVTPSTPDQFGYIVGATMTIPSGPNAGTWKYQGNNSWKKIS